MSPRLSKRRTPARDRLLSAAFDLFYAEGYGVSVDAIAEQAEVAKPTVYAHFPSKEALIEAVLRSMDDQWFAQLAAELDRRQGDPFAQLLVPFDLLATDLRPDYHGCILLNSAATFCSSDHPAYKVLAEHDERMLQVFRQLAKAAGAGRPGELAGQLLVLYDGAKARGLIDRSGGAIRVARAAARALIHQPA
jgi:AcrR family transcriptional regulator